MCHFSDTSMWHGHCGIEGAPAGIRRAAAYRHVISGIPRAHLLLWYYFRENMAMTEDYRKESREALARATEVTAIAIVWGAVIAILLVVIAVI